MGVRKPDILRVVDAAYVIDQTPDSWLVGLAEIAHPLLDGGFGICVFEYRPAETPGAPPEIASAHLLGVPPDLAALHGTIFRNMPPEVRRRPFQMGPCVSGSQMMGEGAAFRNNPLMQMYAQKFGMFDSVWITAAEPSGWGCGFHTGRREISAVSRLFKQRWSWIAGHLSTAARLRQKLRARRDHGDCGAGGDSARPAPEAVFSPNGTLHDATGAAKEKAARDELRRSVLSLEKARGPLRRKDPDEALAQWPTLVMGRWSLLDQMENDGRRYVVACENEPAAVGPESLTERELQVIGYAKLGHHNKLIAYELGIADSTVRVLLSRAAHRLRVQTRAELLAACANVTVTDVPQKMTGT